MPRRTARTAQNAVHAAVVEAAAHGVHATDPEVLADGFNVIVHLRPAPVVARVVLMPALLRSGIDEMITRELAVARFLVERGVPAVRPSGALPAGPHERDGVWLSFWEHLEVLPGFAEAREFGVRLRELHEVLRDFPVEVPALDIPLNDVDSFLRHGRRHVELSDADAKLIGDLRDRLGTEIEALRQVPVQQLHGDAHPGNLLRTPQGWVWTDFEETMVGPVGWDLACLSATTRLDAATAIREYGVEAGSFEVFATLRNLQAACWYPLLAERFPEFGDRARAALDGLRSRVTREGRT